MPSCGPWSEISVPSVVVPTITNQYKGAKNDERHNWMPSTSRNAANVIPMPVAYPKPMVMESWSPKVSPKVVAKIFINQKSSVTCATLFIELLRARVPISHQAASGREK